MPVMVSVPTRIRIDRTALDCHPDWIEAALAAAAGRALAKSREQVLDARGSALGVKLHAPLFSWSGLPVAQAQRTALEKRLTDRFFALANDHGLSEGASAAPAVLPDNPFEAYDEMRGDPITGSYVLPSYEGGKAVVKIAGKPQLDDSDFATVKIISTINDPEFMALWTSLKSKASAGHPLGIIQRISWSPEAPWLVIISKGSGGVIFRFEGFSRLQPRGLKDDPPFRSVFFNPSAGTATAEAFEVPSDDDGRLKLLRQLFEQDLLKVAKNPARKPAAMTTSQWEQSAKDRVETHLKYLVQHKIKAGVRLAVRIRMGTAKTIVWIEHNNPADHWQGKAILSSVVVHERRARAKGGGGGDGSPGGTPGGRADGQEGASRKGNGCPPDDRPFSWDDASGSLENRPLRGEPSLDEIGDAGVILGKQIANIASALQIPAIPYPGQFCYHAAARIHDLAGLLPEMTETSVGKSKASSKGNLGAIEFTPADSPIVAEARRLAGIVAMLTDLIKATTNTFQSDYYRCSIHGWLRGEGVSWSLRLLQDVAPPLKEGIGWMVVGVSRALLIQLLETSRVEIAKRQQAMERYAPLFEKWMVPLISDQRDLQILLDTLRKHRVSRVAQQAAGYAQQGGAEWLAASASLVAAIAAPVKRSAGAAYEIVTEGGEDRIRDQKGVLWTIKELENGIQMKQGVLEGVDPLVKQMKDTPEAMKRFKEAGSIQAELERLLDDMSKKNAEMAHKATSDELFAFKASSISENIPEATVRGSKYSLQGVHKLAHEQIGDAFKGSSYYPMGIDWVFDTELGGQGLINAGIMIGVTALAVVCAPAAVVAGLALAGKDVAEAYEKRALYKALIDPDEVLNYAEVEIGIFVAWFGVVISLIPEAGKAVGGLVKGGKALIANEAKQTVKQAAKMIVEEEAVALAKPAARGLRSTISKELTELAAKDLLAAFVGEYTLNIVMEQVIQQAMKPVLDGLERPEFASQALSPARKAEVQRAHEFIQMVLAAKDPPE